MSMLYLSTFYSLFLVKEGLERIDFMECGEVLGNSARVTARDSHDKDYDKIGMYATLFQSHIFLIDITQI